MKKSNAHTYAFRAKLWRYPSASASWYFVTVDEKVSKALKEKYSRALKGWRMIPISAKVGETVWETSIFPQKDGPYILPIKVAVRKAEGIFEGDMSKIEIRVRK